MGQTKDSTRPQWVLLAAACAILLPIAADLAVAPMPLSVQTKLGVLQFIMEYLTVMPWFAFAACGYAILAHGQRNTPLMWLAIIAAVVLNPMSRLPSSVVYFIVAIVLLFVPWMQTFRPVQSDPMDLYS